MAEKLKGFLELKKSFPDLKKIWFPTNTRKKPEIIDLVDLVDLVSF